MRCNANVGIIYINKIVLYACEGETLTSVP